MSKAKAQSRFLRSVYSRIARKYEMTNHILTFGLDILWRKKAAKMAVEATTHRCEQYGNTREAGSSMAPEFWLDTCTGTGEMAAYLSRLVSENVSGNASENASNNVKVYGVDFSREMLTEAVKKPATAEIRFCGGDMNFLPFPDDTFSLVTMAFATRNNNPDRETLVHRFSEICRVLKSGGLFVNVETSQPPSQFIRQLVHIYIKLYVKRADLVLSGSRKGYAYLAESTLRFYGAEELAVILKEAGFVEVEPTKLMFGVAAVHKARKG